MLPYINIFNKKISSYALMAAIGILFCLFYIIRICKKRNIRDYNYVNMLLFSLIGVLIGGHILYGITNINLIVKFFSRIDQIDSFKTFIDCMAQIFGGSVFYGGLIGGMIVCYIYAKKTNIANRETYDLVIPVVPLFHTFGRIGCFLAGCCYGKKSSVGFMFHTSPIEMANNVNRLPIQLFESVFNLCLFFLLYYLFKNNKLKGYLINLYFILYPVFRFIIEFFRGDQYRGFLFGLSTSQIISIILIIISIINLIIYKRKNNGTISGN